MAWLTRSTLLLPLALTVLATGCDDSPPVDSDDDMVESTGDETTGDETTGDETTGDATDGDETDSGDTDTYEDPYEICPEGYDKVATEAECEADQHCFDWGSGHCSGACPDGTELYVGPTPWCMAGSCGEGEILRRAGEDCSGAEGTYCDYEHHAWWACETCDLGWTLDPNGSAEDAVSCVEACAEGYELIFDEGECLADAGCYELPPTFSWGTAWCTGMCPEGQMLETPDDGTLPFCADA